MFDNFLKQDEAASKIDLGGCPEGFIQFQDSCVPELTPAERAISDIETGMIVECSKEEYLASVRSALQAQAGKWVDQKQDIKAMMALQEVQRLDKIYDPFGER